MSDEHQCRPAIIESVRKPILYPFLRNPRAGEWWICSVRITATDSEREIDHEAEHLFVIVILLANRNGEVECDGHIAELRDVQANAQTR